MNVIWEVLIIRKFVSKVNFFGRNGLQKALIEPESHFRWEGASPTISSLSANIRWRRRQKETGERYLDRLETYAKETNLFSQIHLQSCHKEWELFQYHIKPDRNYVYCGNRTPQIIYDCQFIKSFAQEVLQWFNCK